MSAPVELLGSQAGNNGGGWCQNSQLASREEETGKQAVPGTIITSRVCRSCRSLVDAAKDVSGIHSNEAGAWLAACDFGGWEWRWAGSYHSVARHTAHPGQKVLQSTGPRPGQSVGSQQSITLYDGPASMTQTLLPLENRKRMAGRRRQEFDPENAIPHGGDKQSQHDQHAYQGPPQTCTTGRESTCWWWTLLRQNKRQRQRQREQTILAVLVYGQSKNLY